MPNGIMALLFGVFVGVIAYLMVTWRHYRSVRGPSVLVLTIGWVFGVFVSIVFTNLAFTYLENMR